MSRQEAATESCQTK